ncbi:odorant receptor 13a-like [Hyposmocoma kahamanoa]|uniref:odorant receptor 13a-like n=1 Tax=Hyposmocoma kahamanoa TaxID=1477025 RepID=UPI000E6D7898|nr:odorant receptor 13a-like [Hyposmocoma kahamanoa]
MVEGAEEFSSGDCAKVDAAWADRVVCTRWSDDVVKAAGICRTDRCGILWGRHMYSSGRVKIMSLLKLAWLAITAPALEEATGKLEIAFFESVYRITYALGLSLSDKQTILYYIYSSTVKFIIVLFIAGELWYLLIVYKKLAASLDSPYFDVSTTGRKKILEHWLKMQRRYFWYLLTLSSCTVALWYIHPLTDDIEYNYPATVRFPYDSSVQTTERYIVAYILVLFMFNYISYFVIVNDLIMQAQLIPLVCQYAILCDCFENIITDCSESFPGLDGRQLFANKKFELVYTSRLRKLVEQHKTILAYTQDLRQALNAPMLGQLMASGILICLAGYQLTAALNKSMVRTIMNLLYLSYNMYMFYLLCNWCEEIKMQSRRVGDSVYLSGWERGVVVLNGVRARLMIVVARANKPLVISAGGIYDVSLMSYSTLVKTSYTALTVLLRVRQRDTS